MNQNRQLILIAATVLLLLFAVVYHIWADWGLITIHAKGMPLGKVIASMERQGHARIETDLPTDTPITMDVVKVHLTDALETLSVVSDSRWRLLYFVAGDKATLKGGELAWFGGQQPDDWTMVSFPMGNNMIPLDDPDEVPPLDPRSDIWTPKTAAPAPLQTFFSEAAQVTNAGFAFPKAWNPTVNSAPASGIVNHVVPKLISAAGGHEDQIFFLSKNGRRGPRPDGGGGGEGMASFQFDPDLFATRVQNEINRLPPELHDEAQNNFNTEQAFRASLKDMTAEQRHEAWMAHMQDPVFQQMMANRMDGRDARMNHDQRMQHYSKYVNRKLTAMGRM